jgi:soluble lytic murein transglycosylase
MLARQALGMRLTPAEPGDTLAEADLDAIAALPGGRRAFALLQVGEPALAEAEFRRLWPTLETVAMRRALWLTARAAGLDGLASQLGGLVSDPGRGGPEAPPRLSPRGGFTLDPALVYAVARVESNFDPRAHSGAGAHGMMQVTPIAARAIAPQGRGGLPRDTAGNLQLGQRYMAYLAKDGLAGDDLLRVLASYNAGPASTAHWQTRDGGDPLLFLEAIPVDETRRFVQRTLTFAWSYAARLGVESPSLEAMAEGAWPRFAPERRAH